jgi:hypothetical protein
MNLRREEILTKICKGQNIHGIRNTCMLTLVCILAIYNESENFTFEHESVTDGRLLACRGRGKRRHGEESLIELNRWRPSFFFFLSFGPLFFL